MSAEPSGAGAPRTARGDYWSTNLRLTGVLLAIWFAVTFVVAFFARELTFDFFGWPFSFYMAAQGALIVYFLIIVFYAWYMNRLDHRYGFDERDEDDEHDERRRGGNESGGR